MRKIFELMSDQISTMMQGVEMPQPRTVRIVMPVNVPGTHVRLRFENTDDEQPAHIDHMMLANCDALGVIDPTTSIAVTIHGQQGVTLAPESSIVSDKLIYHVKAGDYLALSVFAPYPQMCVNSIIPLMHQSAPGDYCDKNFIDEDATPPQVKKMGLHIDPQIPLFTALEIRTESDPNIVVCLGDSITQQGYWYTELQRRLYKELPGQICILNAGVSGNRLLKDSQPQYGKIYGQAGLSRLQKDVLDQPGVTHMVFALGINDLLQGETDMDPELSPTAEQFGAACHEVAQRAQEQGVKTMAFTMYPANLDADPEKAVARELLYHAYNAAIRAAGFDRVVELAPMLGAADHKGYRDGLCQSDGLHLNATGGKALADALDIEWFKE